MNDERTTVEAASSGFNGPTSRPEAEEAIAHGGPMTEEGSAVALGNSSRDGTNQHPPDGAASTAARDTAIIVRATARMSIDFMALDEPERIRTRQLLYEARRSTAAASNAVLRALWRADGDTLDAYMAEHGCAPRKASEWPMAKLQTYTISRKAAPLLGAGIASSAARIAENKWRQTRYEALARNTVKPAHFRETNPIPIRHPDYALTKEDGRWWLSFLLKSGEPRVKVPLDIRDSFQRQTLERIFEWRDSRVLARKTGESREAYKQRVSALDDAARGWQAGEIKIEQDPKRKGRWYVRLAYKRIIDKLSPAKSAALHRGIKNFLVCVTEDGQEWSYEGADIEAFLAQMQSRRRQYQRNSLASGRSGHGRKVILRPIEKLAGKADRWRRTKNQTLARRLSEWLHARGVTTLYIEDLAGIRSGEPEKFEGGERIYKRVQEWPFYDAGQRIVSCCEEAGMTIMTVSPAYDSQRCPVCGAIDPEHKDLRHWKLSCKSCGARRDLDVAAGYNVLARGLAVHEGKGEDYKDIGRAKRAAKGSKKRKDAD